MMPFMEHGNVKRLYLTTPDLSARVLRECAALMRDREEIESAFIYGSFLTSGAFHDIDVGIFLGDTAAPAATDIASDISEELSSRFHLQFDVRALNGAPISFVFHVIRGQLVYCRNEERLAARIEQILPRYFDKREFLNHYTREAFAR